MAIPFDMQTMPTHIANMMFDDIIKAHSDRGEFHYLWKHVVFVLDVYEGWPDDYQPR